jgi:hypothetical protein
MGGISTSKAKTATTATDSRVGVSEGIGWHDVGANASVVAVGSGSDLVADAAIASNRDVAITSLNTGKAVVIEGFDLAGDTGQLMADFVKNQSYSDLENRALDTAVLSTALGSNSSLMESTIERLGTLAETKLTDNAAQTQRTLLYVMAGVIALVLLPRLLKRR